MHFHTISHKCCVIKNIRQINYRMDFDNYDPLAALQNLKRPSSSSSRSEEVVGVVPRLGDVHANAKILAALPTGMVNNNKLSNAMAIQQGRRKLKLYEPKYAQFYVPSAQEIIATSVVECVSPAYSGHTTVDSPLMGTTDLDTVCQTCGKLSFSCDGHRGYITLPKPIIHPIFVEQVLQVLNSVCPGCGGLLLAEARRSDPSLMKLSCHVRLAMIAKIVQASSSTVKCPRNQMLAEAYMESHQQEDSTSFSETAKDLPNYCPASVSRYSTSTRDSQDWQIFRTIKGKSGADLPPQKIPAEQIQKILEAITPEDLNIMGFYGDSKPANFILTVLPVIPPRNIPPLIRDGEKKFDHITGCYRTIIRLTLRMNAAIDKVEHNLDGSENELSDLYNKLTTAIRRLINNTDKQTKSGREESAPTIVKRLQGKEGYCRAPHAKRINKCGRTVLGGAVIPIGSVRVPILMTIITLPEKATIYNIQRLKTLAMRGKIMSLMKGSGPSAGNDTRYTRLLASALENGQSAPEIEVGDRVDRMSDIGDIILYNRQPTLHRYSMPCGRMMPGSHFNILIPITMTPQLGADFDGDEINIVGLTTLRARAEALILMGVSKQIVSTANSSILPGLVINGPTAAYLLSIDSDLSPNLPFVTPVEEQMIIQTFLMVKNDIRLRTYYSRLAKHKIAQRTPRALFSLTLPCDFFYRRKYDKPIRTFDEATGIMTETSIPAEVLIMDGIFVKGELTGKDVKDGLIHHINLIYGGDVASRFITEATFMLEYYIERRGFSIGLDDCLINNRSKVRKDIDKSIRDVESRIAEIISVIPRTPFEAKRQEQNILAELSSARKTGSDLANASINGLNPLNIMVSSGAKGTTLNISELCASVGQQLIVDQRPYKNLPGNRTLSYFESADSADSNVRAHGYISESFVDGLSPSAFMFHHSASRCGLTDSQLKTADTGTASKRLRIVVENEVLSYSGSVENSSNMITSHSYGDGFDPSELILVPTKTHGKVYLPINVFYLADALNSTDSFGAPNDVHANAWNLPDVAE